MAVDIQKPNFQLENVEDNDTRFHLDQIRLWVDRLQNGLFAKEFIQDGITDVKLGALTLRVIEVLVPGFSGGTNVHKREYRVPGSIISITGVFFKRNADGSPAAGMSTIRPTLVTTPSDGLRFEQPDIITGGFTTFGLFNDSALDALAKVLVVYFKDGAI